MAAPPYDAVLCDIDGVLRHWPASGHADLDREHGLAEGTFAAAAFHPDRLLPAITGQVTDEEWRAAVAAEIALACGSRETAHAVVAAWSVLMPHVDHDVVSLLTAVRGKAAVALVSNATTRLEHDLAQQGLDGLADAVVNTARIGVAKPDRRVYRIAAERVGIPVHRCLFVDDTAANVAAAREAGMAAVHYRRPQDLHDALSPVIGTRADRAADGPPRR
jgi:putative hydrolase of the HAD superfamily